MISRLKKTWTALRHRDDFEQGLDEELRHHLELRTEHLERTGMSREQAQRQARIELGSRERYRDEARAAFGLRWLDDLRGDVRFALRTLRRSPGFTLTAIVSMALGVGANTVVFSTVNSLLLRPLPVDHPEQLYFINRSADNNLSYPAYRDIRDRAQTISGALTYRITQVALGDERAAEPYLGCLVSGNYFDVLGLQPAAGRFFHAEDERGGQNAAPYVVLSYDVWQTRFHADPQISGKDVRVSGKPFTVLGVAPRGFVGTEAFLIPGVWIPIAMQPQIEGNSWLESRGSHNSSAMVRANAGVSASVVQGEMNRIAADLAREYPSTDGGTKFVLGKPGLFGERLRGPVEAFSAGVLFLSSLVLLAACVNLAALLGARAADRMREIALRVSIGAGRGRIVRQLLTESVVLTGLAGVLGAALAWPLLEFLSGWQPPIAIPVRLDVHPNLRVLLFSAGISILTGVVAGLAPALQAWKLNANDALKGTAFKRRRWSFRDASLFVQTAICCVLIVSSMVAARGVAAVLAARPGLNPDGVSVVYFSPTLAGYEPEEGQRFQRRALETVAALPGVTSAAFGKSVPLGTDQSSMTVFPENAPAPQRLDQGWNAAYYNVSPGYFRTMGTRLVAGSDFGWAEKRPVAIVNETFARRMFQTTNAVGRRFRYFNTQPIEVIGVVEDGKYFTFAEEPRPVVFRFLTARWEPETALIVRSGRPEGQMAAEMARAVRGLDPAMPLYVVGSMRDMMGISFLPAEIALAALGTFGILAIMLSVTGIYGMASYSVSRRVREIGVRMAIGARPMQVLQTILGRLAIVVAGGCAAGLALGLASGQILSAVVYQASPRDPWTLAMVCAVMAAVALASSWGPIRRAIRLDPVRVLREE